MMAETEYVKIGKYDFVEYYEDAKVYIISKDGIYMIVAYDGQVLLRAAYISKPIKIGRNFQVFFKDKNWKYGIAMTNGHIIVKPKYDYMKYFGHGKYHVSLKGNSGIITATGKELISPE